MSVTVNLGPRLQLVASYVPKDSRLGDIGTDHAYLPIYLWENGGLRHAIAVDVHKGPYLSALSAIQSRRLESVIDVRYGDGLKPVQPGEVDTLTLAGMGGNTMLEIFNARPEVMAQVQTLILQPQGAEGKVRLTLLQAGWKLKEEQLVEEEGRIYVVMKYSREEGFDYEEFQGKVKRWFERVHGECAEGLTRTEGVQGNSQDELLAKLVWEFGPLILENPVPGLRVLLEDQIQAIARTTREMHKSSQPEVQMRIKHLNLKYRLLEEMKTCLFPSV
jgi:tRNA (adenine22-N1)-methyltransferase